MEKRDGWRNTQRWSEPGRKTKAKLREGVGWWLGEEIVSEKQSSCWRKLNWMSVISEDEYRIESFALKKEERKKENWDVKNSEYIMR